MATDVVDAPVRRGIWLPFADLLGGQVAAALLGLLFWVVAARAAGSDHVGMAAAAMSTQTLLGLLVSLGLGTHMVSALPQAGEEDRRRLVVRALALIALVGTAVGLAAVAVSPTLGGSLGDAMAEPGMPVVFVVGVVAAGWVLVLDEAVLGVGRSRLQLGRNLVASVLRFGLAAVLLLALGLNESVWLDLCWVAPLAVTAVGVVVRLGLPARLRSAVTVRADARAHLPAALRHYLLNLALAAATQIVPVVAGLVLLATDNAAFAVAWLLATSAYLPPYLLAMALFAHAANEDAAGFRVHMRRTLPFALGLSFVICLGTWVLGGPILAVFGSTYNAESRTLLSLLVVAGLAMVVKDHLITFWRGQQRFRTATVLAAVALVSEAAGAAVGGLVDDGRGLVLGWLVVLLAESLVTVPWLLLVLRGGGTGRPATPATPAAGMSEPLPDPLTHPPAGPTRRGPAPWRVALGVGVALVSVAVGVLSVQQARSGATSAGYAAKAPVQPTVATIGCRPTDDRPGPLVDLAVDPGTGDPARPFSSPAYVDRLVDLAAAAGADVVSTPVPWSTVRARTGAGYDWRGLDEVLAAATSRGLAVRVVLQQTPQWAVADWKGPWTPPTTPVELARWAKYVRDVTHHLDGRATYLEVWPEPDRLATWRTGVDPAAFVRLLRTTRAAASAADPAITLVSGGLAANDIGYLHGMYANLGDGPRPYDQVGLHPYGVGPPSRATSFVGYRSVHASMVRNGDGDVPLYLGAFGYSNRVVDDAKRADYLTQSYDLATCTPYVTALSWYDLHPTPVDPPQRSLLDSRLVPNETYAALQRWTASR